MRANNKQARSAMKKLVSCMVAIVMVVGLSPNWGVAFAEGDDSATAGSTGVFSDAADDIAEPGQEGDSSGSDGSDEVPAASSGELAEGDEAQGKEAGADDARENGTSGIEESKTGGERASEGSRNSEGDGSSADAASKRDKLESLERSDKSKGTPAKSKAKAKAKAAAEDPDDETEGESANDAEITIDVSSDVAASKGSTDYFKADKVTVTVTVVDDDFDSAESSVKVGGDTKGEWDSAGDGKTFKMEFELSASEAKQATEIVVNARDEAGEKKGAKRSIVIDDAAPDVEGITWEFAGDIADGVHIDDKGENGATFSVRGKEAASKVGAVATIIVKDANLRVPEDALNAGDGEAGIVASPEGQATVAQEWTEDPNEPGKWTCKIKFEGAKGDVELAVTGRDWAQRESVTSETSCTLEVVEKEAPTVSVAWGADEGADDDGVKCYKRREATVVIVDDKWSFDSDPDRASKAVQAVKGKGEGEGGSLEWSDSADGKTHEAKVVFEETADDCSLSVNYVDAFGSEAESYASEKFNILANPAIMGVSYSVALAGGEGTDEKPHYVLVDGVFSVAIKVKDPAFAEDAYTVGVEQGTTCNVESQSWDNSDGIERTYTVTFDSDGYVGGLTVKCPAGTTVAEGLGGTWESPTWHSGAFYIDSAAPLIAKVSFLGDGDAAAEAKHVDSSSNTRYYDVPVSAQVQIEEKNLGVNGEGINVMLGGQMASDATGPSENDIWTFKTDAVDPGESKEGKYELEISGEDLVGKKLLVTSDDDVSAVLVDGGGKYTCAVVVDRHSPELSVAFDPDTLGEDEVILSNDTVNATVTISDDYFASEGGEAVITDESGKEVARKELGAGQVEIPIEGEKGKDLVYTLTITGKDRVGHELVGSSEDTQVTDGVYAQTIEIDRKAPVFKVSYDPAKPADKEKVNGVEARFTNEDVKASISVTEKNFAGGNIKAQVTFEPTDKTKAGNTEAVVLNQVGASDVYQGEYAIDSTAGDGVYLIEVTGADEAGNSLSVDSSDRVTQGGFDSESYKSQVIVDKTAPTLLVSWGDKATNGKYYKRARTAEAVITEQYLDESSLKVDGESASWKTSGAKHSYSRSYEEEGTFSLKIEAADKAGNVLEAPEGESVDDGAPSATQGGVIAEGAYTSAKFVIDLTAPVVRITANQARAYDFDGVDYYNSGKKLTMRVAVTDKHFDPANDSGPGAKGTKITWTGKQPTKAYSVDGWKSKAYSATFEEHGSGGKWTTMKVTVYDLAGNATTYNYGSKNAERGTTKAATQTISGNSKFALDITAPEIQATSGDDIPSQDYSNIYSGKDKKTGATKTYLFYKSKTRLQITIVDVLGVHDVELTGKYQGYTIAKTTAEKTRTSYPVQVVLKDGEEFTKSFTLRADDNAGNYRIWRINPKKGTVVEVGDSSAVNTPLYLDQDELYPTALIQDTQKPVLSWGGGAEAGKYYNSARTLRLNVDELNFRYLARYDKSQIVVTQTKAAGYAGRAQSESTVAVRQFSASDKMGGKYYYDLPFAEDGHYSLVADLTDPAGNKAATLRMGEFTIDRTAPTMQVTWDNNNALNGNYYNAPRTATITVTEHNFDPGAVSIQTTGAIGGWANNGDVHTCTVSFGSDGTYSLGITGRDMANNALQPYTEPEFVVDLTAPTLDISYLDADGNAVPKAEDERYAFNDVVRPVITAGDEANYNAEGLSFTLEGAKVGDVTQEYERYAYERAASGTGEVVTYDDFLREIGLDDIYTITAKLTDLAGNEAEEATSTFSVNRFGSNFIVESPAGSASAGGDLGYLDAAPEIVIREVNVEKVAESTIAVTYNLKTVNLERQKDVGVAGYTVEDKTGKSDYGWSEYRYTIAPQSFMSGDGSSADGNYSVVVTTQDVSGNTNSSALFRVADDDSRLFAVVRDLPAEDAVDAPEAQPDASKNQVSAEVRFTLDTTPPDILGLNVENNQVYNNQGDKEVTFAVSDNIGYDDATGIKVSVNGQEVAPNVNSGSGEVSFAVPEKPFEQQALQITVQDLAGNTASVGGAPDSPEAFKIKVTSDIFDLYGFYIGVGCGIGAAAIGGGIWTAVRRRKEAAQD